MPHVTFIHGIANKPEPEELLKIWRRALTETDNPLNLAGEGVTSSLVYWADLMYERPDPDIAAHEGVLENTPQAVDASGGADTPVGDDEAERRFIADLRQRLTTMSDGEINAAAQDPSPVPGMGSGPGLLERVPLPWFLKKPLMSVLLRDVHHYLFDKAFGPPGKPAVRIQQAIRQRFVQALAAPASGGRHVVVSHSMGTVIAYDCLKRLGDCPAVDGLITIGSPLGLDEVQDRLQPGWTRGDGFLHERVRDGWFNLFDRLDPVCGFDPELGNDFQRGGTRVLADQVVSNPGAWRHSATKYLRQPAFGQALRSLLKL